MKIYVPDYVVGNCAYVVDAERIRVYESTPERGYTINYRDYYINSHYLYNDGSTTFSNYSTLPTCLADADISTNYYYRNDLADILTSSFIIILFAYFIIKKIVRAFLYGGRYA